jgi:alkylation response protein AidB-like acyl-CoA dehydrogenase
MEEESFIASQETNADKRKTLEVAEAAREKDWKHPSFAKQLFMGDVDWKLIHPFPQQTPEEKAEGDLYIDELSSYLSENLDADLVDETRTIPPEVIDELFKRGVFAMIVPKEYG